MRVARVEGVIGVLEDDLDAACGSVCDLCLAMRWKAEAVEAQRGRPTGMQACDAARDRRLP